MGELLQFPSKRARRVFGREEAAGEPEEYIAAVARGRRVEVWHWARTEGGCREGRNLTIGVKFSGIDDARVWAEEYALEHGLPVKIVK
jgi:hypothetical protein